MKITIIQTTTKTFNEARVLLATRATETYLIEPEVGKILKNKVTGQLFFTGLCIDKERKIQDYEEVDKIED